VKSGEAAAGGGAEVADFPKKDVLEVGAAAAGAEVVGSPKRGVLEVCAAAGGGAEVVGSPKRGVLEVCAAAGGGAEVARVPKKRVSKAGSGGAAEDPAAKGSEKLDAKADVCEVPVGSALEKILVLSEDLAEYCRNERFLACVALETSGGN
jgi:hypothetical protein